MFKKTTFASLGLIMSSLAFAGTMGPSCVPGDVTVPCPLNQWNLGVEALYLKPVHSAHRGYEFTPLDTYRSIDNEEDWGYRIEGSYHFSTGNDITMTWVHFDNESSQGGFAGFTPFSGPFLLPFNFNVDTRFDQVNLVMGQHVDMGLFKKTRFYAGLQYAKVRLDSQNQYLLTPPTIARFAPAGFVLNRNTDFNGVGPVVGIDYAYHLTPNFSVTANGAGSILYGASRYDAGFVFLPSGLIPATVYASKKSIVPGVEAKLGVNYGWMFPQGVLNIEVGYQVIDYFNLEDWRGITGFGVAKNSDFGLYGPYAGLKWVGIV